ncbi:MAG: hypothetical protein A3K67_04850, partial [Euryarchaeota archaeon RBG_16_62_10]
MAVDRARAEELRLELTSLGLVDKAHAIVDDGRLVVVPALERPSRSFLGRFGARIVEREFPSRRSRRDPIDDIRACADVPSAIKPMLPGKWELYGQVLVIKLDSALDRYEREIAEAYADVLGARTVLRDVGGVAGEFRRPVVKRLLGTDTVAIHRENGIVYKFDAAEIMFSSGNMDERVRMASVRCDGETVVDMFAGIGYLSLPLAVHQRPAKVIACEVNQVAHSYLVENISLNHVAGIVEPFLGDNRALPGHA